MISTQTISFNYDDHSYFVTVNGRRLGDSRGYENAHDARLAALADVDAAKPNEDGTRFRIYKPGWVRPA